MVGISHSALISYLENVFNFEIYKSLSDAVSLQGYIDGRFVRFLIPTDNKIPHYREELLYKISKLANYLLEDEDTLIEDIFFDSDVLEFRLADSKLIDNSIPLVAIHYSLLNALEGIRQSSRDYIQKNVQDTKGIDIVTNELVNNCRMSQTQAGSFKYKVFVPKIKTKKNISKEIKPFVSTLNRKTTENYYSITKEIKQKLESTSVMNEFDFFKYHKPIVVSLHEFLKSEKENLLLEVKPKWSKRIKQNIQNFEECLSFNEQHFIKLEPIIHRIKNIVNKDDDYVDILGSVNRLNFWQSTRVPDVYEGFAYITYNDPTKNKAQKARVTLTPEMYREAYKVAGSTNLAMYLKCRISYRTRLHIIEDIIDFKIHEVKTIDH